MYKSNHGGEGADVSKLKFIASTVSSKMLRSVAEREGLQVKMKKKKEI